MQWATRSQLIIQIKKTEGGFYLDPNEGALYQNQIWKYGASYFRSTHQSDTCCI